MGVFQKKKLKTTSLKPSEAGIGEAIAKGNAVTKLSLIVFGLGNILNKQIGRGLIFLLYDILWLWGHRQFYHSGNKGTGPDLQ